MVMENGNGNRNGMVPVEGDSNLVGAGTSADTEATQAVQVALNIRPLIALERVQGCKDCISVVPSEPQVQIGHHCFTFDNVFGSSATPLNAIFDKCVKPLVEGLFQGYNATVLAYGQTGSGKTYTMGTGYTVGGSTEGVTPQVMATIFKRIDALKHKADFQLRVSFIEILKEEVHDLLDPNPPSTEFIFGGGLKALAVGKPPIQIRETTNGGITLAGVTEADVKSLDEMAACLEQGSLCRATGTTNMNSHSSRSHAIFTITLEQRRKWDLLPDGENPSSEDCSEDYLCAKLHLVDLAGSERAKRTGADGLRFKEGVHINKGLLALGNVISALGDDKKRREGGHVPYRDSKLTRLLQDSLGGNSRTVMIACVSPADSNAEETLNTLKYANRARNIQNKPTVNRDPMAAEMQRMRQQLELMQAELICARAGGPSNADVQMLKQKIAWLEACNSDLRRELEEARERLDTMSQCALESQVERDKLKLKLERLRSGKTFEELDKGLEVQTDNMLEEYVSRIQELEAELRQLQYSRSLSSTSSRPPSSLSSHSMVESAAGAGFGVAGIDGDIHLPPGEPSGEAEAEAVAKELEHTVLQENLDRELQELNKRLELKEAEMKTFVRSDTVVLKQHFEKKLVELEEEKKYLQKERDKLITELETLAHASDEHTQNLQEAHMQKLKQLESQIAELKKKQENQSQLLRQKQRSDEAAKRLQDEIVRMKTQKVQIQQKMKQESEQFRLWKAAREKEVLQLKKEGRRNAYELHKIQALHQRQKMVLQRKTEEAAMAMRRLKELLEARRSPRDTAPNGALLLTGPTAQTNEKSLQHWLEQELEMAVRVHEVRSAVEKQREERSSTAKELMELKQREEKMLSSADDPDEESNARHARITHLENMLNASSSDLVTMASQLSEAEDRNRACSGRARWQHLRSMGDAKTLLHLIFNVASYSRCRLQDMEEESKELKEKLTEAEQVLRQTEVQRQELERQNREQVMAIGLAAAKALSDTGRKLGVEETSVHLGGLSEKKLNESSHLSGSGSVRPYDLRKAARGPFAFKHSLLESDMDLSDSQSDYEAENGNLSDSESDSDEEGKTYRRRVARKTQAGPRAIHAGRKQPPVNRDSSSISSDVSLQIVPLSVQEPKSLGRNPNVSDETFLIEEESTSKSQHSQCCSCNQRSGCKTKKCECKAAGGLCGSQCGCKAGRCANRWEIVARETTLPSSNEMVPFQTEMAQAMAGLRVDSPQRGLHASPPFSAGNISSIGPKTKDSGPSPQTERILVKRAATLLDSAWKERTQSSDSSEDRRDISGHISTNSREGSMKEEVGSKRPRRPLSDIGNKKGPSEARGDRPLVKPKRKIQRGLVQLVSIPSAPNQQSATASGIAATASALAAVTAFAASTKGATSGHSTRDLVGSLKVHPASHTKAFDGTASGHLVRDLVIPLRVHPTLPRRNIHSPLRSRDNGHGAGVLGLQTSVVEASGSNGRRKGALSSCPGSPVASVRASLGHSSAPASPIGNVRTKDEQENLRTGFSH